MFKNIAAAAAIFISGYGIVQASPVTVTQTLNLSSLALGPFSSAVTVDGFTLTPSGGLSVAPRIVAIGGYSAIQGSDWTFGDDTLLTRTGGGAYNLVSVVIGTTGSNGQAIGGTDMNGNNVNYDLSGLTNGTPQTIDFGTTFVNAQSLDLDALFGAYFADIKVSYETDSSSVPEPSSLALLGIPAGLGLVRARRRAKPIVGQAG